MKRNRSFSTAVTPRVPGDTSPPETSRLGPAPRPSIPEAWLSGTDDSVKCVAIKSYQGEQDDDLTFDQGDIVEVGRAQLLQPIHWWRGYCKGRHGLFPASHVKPPTEFLLSHPAVDETSVVLLLPNTESDNQGETSITNGSTNEAKDNRLTEEDISDLDGELLYEDVEEEGVPGRTTKVIASGRCRWASQFFFLFFF